MGENVLKMHTERAVVIDSCKHESNGIEKARYQA